MQIIADIIPAYRKLTCSLQLSDHTDVGVLEAGPWKSQGFSKKSGLPGDVMVSVEAELKGNKKSGKSLLGISNSKLTSFLHYTEFLPSQHIWTLHKRVKNTW